MVWVYSLAILLIAGILVLTCFLSTQKCVRSVCFLWGVGGGWERKANLGREWGAVLSRCINPTQATVRSLLLLRKSAQVTTSLSCSNCPLEHSQMASQWGVICLSRVFSHLSVQLKRELKDIIGICNVPCKVSGP